MDFVEILFFISLICGLMAEKKIPAGVCVTKIVDGKLVQVGDCKKNDGSDILNLIKKNLEEKEKAESKCGVTYNSKYFRAVVYRENNVTFNAAESICKSMNNGKPANIYDLAHLQFLFKYLRLLIPADQDRMQAWTGMEYENNQLFLSTGEEITIATEGWFPGFPQKSESYKNVAVELYKDPEYSSQGLFNYPPSFHSNAVICEI
uniref:uncharacterized protein LOC120336348 n=1 Tax=Styela clava TaxID=7725 RepID=UPI001939BEE7|nr:uncharacterized protein LOC120336348 [Styela clava]